MSNANNDFSKNKTFLIDSMSLKLSMTLAEKKTEAEKKTDGITADGNTAAPLPGLYSVGECSSVGIHGANRLGSNSLSELLVFGKVAGQELAGDGVDQILLDHPLKRARAIGRVIAARRRGSGGGSGKHTAPHHGHA